MFIGNMPNDEYHAHSAVSKTQLDMIERDPHLIDWSRNCPKDDDKMSTFDFGDAMHAICLEPERLESEFIVMPSFNLRTNAGKEEKAEFIKEHAGKKLLTADEGKKLRLMFESVMAHKQARELIEMEGIAEGSWFWKDGETGLDCRCRPDKQIEGLLVDVKTTDSLAKFHYSVDDYRYYVQDPYYCDGLQACGIPDTEMVFLVIQKTIEIGRYPVMVVRLPVEAIEYGRIQYQKNLRQYAEFLASGKETDIRELEMSYRFIDRAMELTTEVQL